MCSVRRELIFAIALLAIAHPASAQTAPAPYSLPWQMRSVAGVSFVRAETTFASYEDALTRHGLTTVQSLSAGYKIPGTGPVGGGLVPSVRLTMLNDSPPVGKGGMAFMNPLVALGYTHKLKTIRLHFSLGFGIPVGMTGGNAPREGPANSRAKGVLARSAMENSIYGVNDASISPGFGIAYVKHGFTMQLEATLIHSRRVRGEVLEPETSKTNFTSGLHVAYFFFPELSIGAELRHQHYLNAPLSVEQDPTHRSVDNTTIAAGPRVHIHLGGTTWFRPGIAYARGLDKPMAAATPNYHIVQLDLPFAF